MPNRLFAFVEMAAYSPYTFCWQEPLLDVVSTAQAYLKVFGPVTLLILDVKVKLGSYVVLKYLKPVIDKGILRKPS